MEVKRRTFRHIPARAEKMASFDDYGSQLIKDLHSLRHFERCIFMSWCAEHLLSSHIGIVEQVLPESDVRILQNILDKVWDVLLAGSIPDTKMLDALDDAFMQVAPGNTIAATEFQPIVQSVQVLAGICILGCRRNAVTLAQQAGEETVSAVAQELYRRSTGRTPDSAQEVFQAPEVQEEMAAQLAMVQELKRGYALDASLRSAFRR